MTRLRSIRQMDDIEMEFKSIEALQLSFCNPAGSSSMSTCVLLMIHTCLLLLQYQLEKLTLCSSPAEQRDRSAPQVRRSCTEWTAEAHNNVCTRLIRMWSLHMMGACVRGLQDVYVTPLGFAAYGGHTKFVELVSSSLPAMPWPAQRMMVTGHSKWLHVT